MVNIYQVKQRLSNYNFRDLLKLDVINNAQDIGKGVLHKYKFSGSGGYLIFRTVDIFIFFSVNFYNKNISINNN